LIRSAIAVPREFVNEYIFNFPDTSFAWAFVLVLLAAALAARKRIAWLILVGYLLAAVGLNVGELLSGDESWVQEIGEFIGLAFHVAAIAFLLLARKEFWARVRRGALLKAAGVLVAAMAIGTLTGWALLELFPGTLPRPERLWYALNRVSAFSGADANSFTGHPHVFVNALLGLFGALALMAAAIVLFQSQRADNALTGEDESAIRGLLELYGKNDSLGYFATRRDKAAVFAPNGRAAIAYRVEVGVCLAGGDPVGDQKSWPQAIEAWLGLCQSYGWAPGVMGASSTAAQAFRAAGLSALQLGDEAILHPDGFRLSGPDMRAVRQAVTRARRAGTTVRIRRHRDIDAAEMAQLVIRADAWRDTDDERGFSMALGRIGDPADGDCLLVEALHNAGQGDDGRREQVVAMLSLVPWGTNGVSLDLMRRSPQSPNGSIELMVSELCLQSEDIGVTRISLNFAMFRSAFEQGAQLGAGPVARLWRWLLVFFSRWWQLETLYRSNMKYQPEWVPRFACYEDARLVPRVGVASVIAEGFLVLPFSRCHEQPHTGQHIAAPGTLVASGVLHSDGTAPDLSSLQADLADTDELPRLPEQVRVRRAKLRALQHAGVDAYPVGRPPSHTVAQALAAESGSAVTVAGRVLRLRDYGGANARPFLTHINAYDLDLYLRIAPELYLKRLCVGGVERVFELGRAFRNEGVDFSHNPEFTLLEAYQAHADYNVWIDGCRGLIQNAAVAANGAQVFLRPGSDGTLDPVDISGPWPVKTVHGAVSEALGEDIEPQTDLATLRRLCDVAGIAYLTHWDTGALVLELYEQLVEDRTGEPTFYKDFPTTVSPLTRPHRSIPGVAERWDLVAWGVELATAYSELTDPVEQRRRLQEQSLLAAGGDPEAMELDEDFLQAMEYAMPPTGGLGMGVDRVVMLITGRSIRETLPFPLAKPR